MLGSEVIASALFLSVTIFKPGSSLVDFGGGCLVRIVFSLSVLVLTEIFHTFLEVLHLGMSFIIFTILVKLSKEKDCLLMRQCIHENISNLVMSNKK